jgi:hypothetical protein
MAALAGYKCRRMILFINGFLVVDWAQHEVAVRNRHCYTGAAVTTLRSRTLGAVRATGCVIEMFDPNKTGNVYSPSRDIVWGPSNPAATAIAYWDSVKRLFESGFGDQRSFFINGSFDNPSEAQDRYIAGIAKGREIIRQWQQGEAAWRQGLQALRTRERQQRMCLNSSQYDQQFFLSPNEKLRIVAHSMGAAYAAGLVSVLARHPQYGRRIDVVVYLAPHQPADFVHPSGIRGFQSSSAEDLVASNPMLPALKGRTRYALIRNVPVQNFIQNRTYGQRRYQQYASQMGHSVYTYDDEIRTFFQRYQPLP